MWRVSDCFPIEYGKNSQSIFILTLSSLFSIRRQLLKCWELLSRFRLTLLLPTLPSLSHQHLKQVSHSRSLLHRSRLLHLRPSVRQPYLHPTACPRRARVKMSEEN